MKTFSFSLFGIFFFKLVMKTKQIMQLRSFNSLKYNK